MLYISLFFDEYDKHFGQESVNNDKYITGKNKYQVWFSSYATLCRQGKPYINKNKHSRKP